MAALDTYRPDPVYPAIGESFYDPVKAADFPRLMLRFRNQRWAERLGLGALSEDEWIAHFGRFTPLPGNLPSPLAMRYHGHQFRVYNPDIGDGRGFLFAQLRDPVDGRLLDLGTKGSGQTPYSRFGDGRLTLKGGVREALITALLEALGVSTSMTFSLIETGEQLYRNDEPSPTRSSVLVRLSHSHIRFGTFQRHAFERSEERLSRLVDHCVEYYHPELLEIQGEARVAAFVNAVSERSAALVASWMAAGFVHGVLNTDNMNVTGESFDYGPYRMLPFFDPAFTAAYFDETGLYAFGRQPETVFWNLKQLAGALSLVCSKDLLVAALESFPTVYQHALRDKIFWRLGLVPKYFDADVAFIDTLFVWLNKAEAPFEQFFFDWHGGDEARAARSPSQALYARDDFAPVRTSMKGYAAAAPERLAHPYFAREKPTTLLIDEIESLWGKIAEADDWSALHAKLEDIELMRQALHGRDAF